MLTPILGRKLIFFHLQTTTVDASRLLQAPLLLDYSQLVALTKAAPLNDGYLTLSVQYSVNTTAASKLSEQLFGNWLVKLQQLQTCGECNISICHVWFVKFLRTNNFHLSLIVVKTIEVVTYGGGGWVTERDAFPFFQTSSTLHHQWARKSLKFNILCCSSTWHNIVKETCFTLKTPWMRVWLTTSLIYFPLPLPSCMSL